MLVKPKPRWAFPRGKPSAGDEAKATSPVKLDLTLIPTMLPGRPSLTVRGLCEETNTSGYGGEERPWKINTP